MITKRKRIVVTGANGFVGTAVVKELIDHGYEVVAMHRKTSSTKTISDLPCLFAEADITDYEVLLAVFKGADAIMHIAALFREAKYPDSEYARVNVDGTRNVFEAAIACGVPRVIHCSTNGVHANIAGTPTDETTAFKPGDVYQVSKLDGELLASNYYVSGKITGIIIRPAMIWGPGDTRFLKLFKGLKTGKMPLIDGRALFHWILVSDLARSFRLAYEAQHLNNEAFIIAGDKPHSIRHCYNTIAAVFGRKAPSFAWPAKPFQILGSIVETICVPFGIQPPIYRRRVDFFTKTRAFSTEKAKRLLGFTPENSFEDEAKLIGAWYEEHGWL
jgi:nucleoside-diphosphate-sugar epimerase